MIYFILFISILCILLINLYLYKDIISPALIVSCMYFVSIICALIGFFTWNIEQTLNLNTYFVIVIGLVGFSCGEFVRRKIKTKESKTKVQFINNRFPNDIITVFIILFILFTIIITIFEITNICKNYGFSGGNLPSMLNFFRRKNDILSGGAISADYDLSFIVKQFIKISYVLTVFYEYFFIKAFFIKAKKSILIKYAICIVLGMCCTLLSTGRSILFHMIYAFLIILIIYNSAVKGKISFKSKRIRRVVVLFFIICFIGLYALMPLLGRTNNGGLIEYTSFAIGTHIPSLNRILRDENDDVILESVNLTFNNFEKSLNRLGILSNYKESKDVWYSFDRYASNTFTSLFSYYHDFGFIGVFLLQFIFGFIVTHIYIIVIKNKSFLGLIIYSYFFYAVVDQIRGDQFYGLITLSSIAYFIIIFILYFIFFIIKSLGVDYCEKQS